MGRDLQKDLDLCESLEDESWKLGGGESPCIIGVNTMLAAGELVTVDRVRMDIDPLGNCDKELRFIVEAYQGWPHAIRRAMEAEALLRDVAEALESATCVCTHDATCGSCRAEAVLTKDKKAAE